jgi:acetyl-CoA acetyltransferase
MFTHYQQTYGAAESDLAQVAISLRSAAERNANAIMRTPLTVEAYLAAPYVVRPLRRLDLCLPNDGAVCLVLHRRGSTPTPRRSGVP